MHRTVIVWAACLSNMAAAGCVFHRTLTRSRPAPNQVSSSPPVVCRDFLFVVDVQRYSRDQGSSVYFPQAVLSGDDLYDITLTDGDCRLQVTLDPGLNRLVERSVLRPGSTLRNATFTAAMTAQLLPACPGASEETDSYRLVSAEVRGHEDDVRRSDVDWDTLPWFGPSEPAGHVVPLRANRSVFLPLWNSVDYSREGWREAPPTEEEEDEEDEEEEEEGGGRRPAVTVSELRDSFLSGRRGVARGAVQHQLIVRIISKSHLMYYGRTDRNCDCPYKALLEVCDQTGKSSVSPEHLPPAATYSFSNSKDLQERSHGDVCDVIGLLTFSGRAERIRSKDGRGAELLEYRWLRLEDGTSDQPIMVKLFSTSQPEVYCKLHPLCVVVVTRLKLIRSQADSCCHLTNTTYTQVYCTGLGHHSEMSYRRLPQVQRFLQWLRSQDDQQVLSRALIGGFFMYPPPPSLETYMKDRRGEPGFLRGAEVQREVERLCYRERRTFCIQATVTMVTYSCRGEEDHCLFWTDRALSLSPLLPPPLPPLVSLNPPLTCLPPPPPPPPPHSLPPPPPFIQTPLSSSPLSFPPPSPSSSG
ncbi:hypothetical protein INR49_001155, partial [Caranx melampygus]